MAKVYRDSRMMNANGKPAFCIRFKGLDGKYHRERTDAATKAEAEALLRRRLSEQTEAKAKGLQNLDASRPVPFATFYTDKYLPALKARVKPSTVNRMEYLARHVLPFFGKLTLRGINAGHVADYLAKRAKGGPSPHELNLERGLVSAVLNEAFRRGMVDVNEAARVRPLKEAERDLWLTSEDVDLVLAHAEAWVKPFIVLAVHTGLRGGELVAVAWADLDHSPGWLRVPAEKTGKVRFVPVNSAVRAVLDAQARRRLEGGRQPWVFWNARRKGAYKRNSVYHGFKAAAEAAGASAEARGHAEQAARLRDATLHTCRHTFASWAIQAGVPIAEVQQYLGHGSDVMTRRYAHLAPAAKERRGALDVLAFGKIGARVAQDACAGKAEAVSS